jgi:hypothetical protein
MVKESGQLLRVPPHGGRDREGKSFTLDLVNARRSTQLLERAREDFTEHSPYFQDR